MNILKSFLLLVAVVTPSLGTGDLHSRWAGASADAQLPELTEHERKQMAKFESPTSFEKAWKYAGKKLHEDIEKIKRKKNSLFHHRKVRKVIYVDEDEV